MALTEYYAPDSTNGWVDQYGTRFETNDIATLLARCSDTGLTYDNADQTITITGNAILQKDAGDDADYNTTVGVCLLYTSPSPRDRTRSRMPSSA